VLVPPDVVGSAGADLELRPVDTLTLAAAASGFRVSGGAYDITLTDLNTGAPIRQPASPLGLEYQLSAEEINQVAGDLSRLSVATLTNDSWVALPCTRRDSTLECSTSHLSLFALIVAPRPSDALDAPLADGRFYKQANGFNGAGDLGFAVVDDADASFWSEFQRLGGVEGVGYPISQRFSYGGFLTQAFQKLVLQWRPDLNETVTVNIFDDLAAHGSDRWLETTYQIPSAPAATVDAETAWEDTVDSHVQLLDEYPALRAFYDANPDVVTIYGLPMAVKQYGPVVTVRMQRGTLQFWAQATPLTPEGSVSVGNGGDLARDAGLFPVSAVAPSAQPSILLPDADQRD
jgi:hypothetical protein